MYSYKAIKINGKKYDEHRVIMERIIGRPLARNEVVHHKDGNKRNNRPENLELQTLSEHSRQHSQGKKMSEESKQKIRLAKLGNTYNRALTQEQVFRIKRLRAEGVTFQQIAQIVGTNQTTARNIVVGRSYADL